MGVAWGKTGENEERSACTCNIPSLVHRYTGVKSFMQWSNFDFFKYRCQTKQQSRPLLEVFYGYSALIHLHGCAA